MILLFKLLLVLGLIGQALCDVKQPQSVGYPLFIASFDEHGDHRRIESRVQPHEVADAIITNMFKGCPSKAYIVIKDMSLFDAVDLNIMKKHTMASMTVASLLTDLPIQMHNFAEDLADHCGAELIELDPSAKDFVPVFDRNSPRVYYLEFDSSDEIDKNAAIKAILKTLHGPHTSIIYENFFSTSTPIFANVDVSEQRLAWGSRERAPRVKPTIAPLDEYLARIKDDNKSSTQATLFFDIPDDVLRSILLASIVMLVLLIAKNIAFTSDPSFSKTSSRPLGVKDNAAAAAATSKQVQNTSTGTKITELATTTAEGSD